MSTLKQIYVSVGDKISNWLPPSFSNKKPDAAFHETLSQAINPLNEDEQKRTQLLQRELTAHSPSRTTWGPTAANVAVIAASVLLGLSLASLDPLNLNGRS